MSEVSGGVGGGVIIQRLPEERVLVQMNLWEAEDICDAIELVETNVRLDEELMRSRTGREYAKVLRQLRKSLRGIVAL